MRTIAEVEAQLLDWEELPDTRDQDAQYDRGMQAGFRTAIRMLQAGNTSAGILDYAQADERDYVSVGDDYADAWQNGYSTALYWAAEQFDWDTDGAAVFRDGNT